MPKYYIVSDCVMNDFRLVISANNPKEAAIKAIKNAVDKYHVVYEPSSVYVDQRGYRSNNMNATNVFDINEILRNIIA